MMIVVSVHRLCASIFAIAVWTFQTNLVVSYSTNTITYKSSISSRLISQNHDLSRRAFWRKAMIGGSTAIVVGLPLKSQAETLAVGPLRIRQWPSLQYLVPLYTFQFALDQLAQNLQSESGAEGIRRSSQLVDQFFAGGFLSNSNVYRGMCAVYIQEIQYDEPDRKRVNDDRVARIQYCDKSVDALKSMQKPLRQLYLNGSDVASDSVLASLDEARLNTQTFLSQIPQRDLDNVAKYLERVNQADSNHDGQLQQEEIDTLNREDRQLYMVVGDILG